MGKCLLEAAWGLWEKERLKKAKKNISKGNKIKKIIITLWDSDTPKQAQMGRRRISEFQADSTLFRIPLTGFRSYWLK